MVVQVREDELLSKVVVTNGKKEWYCCFCSETNVWTRAKCPRCKNRQSNGVALKPFASSVHE